MKVLLLLILICNIAHAEVTFVQISDPQFGWFADNKFVKEKKRLNRAIKYINKIRPDFVIFTGDMIDMPMKNRKRTLQIREFKKTISKIKVPVKFVSGNHDVGNIPTRKLLLDYRKNFYKDKYVFYVKGIKFIVINSSLYRNGSRLKKEWKIQDKWFKRNIRNTSVVFSHHQLFINAPYEPYHYFSWPKKLRFEILGLLRNNNVKYFITGHYHRPKIKEWRGVKLISAPSVSCPLGKSKSGFFIIKVNEGTIHQKLIEKI